MTAAYRPSAAVLLLVPLLLAVLLAAPPVRCSVDEFQCACGHDARRHVRDVRAALDAGDVATAARAAAAYGTLARRMLSVAYGARPEPTARWLWLMDLYADGARGLDDDDETRTRTRGRRLRDDLDRVRGELDRHARLCEASGQAGPAAGRRSRAEFERYLLERVTDGAADETLFEPDRLYLDHVAGRDNGTAALADAVMPRDAGVEWADAAARLAGLYRAARRGGASGTRRLVLFQKRIALAVAATAMAHALVHVTHFQEYRRACGENGGDCGGGGGGGGGDDDGGNVGQYERAWMSVGGLLDKFRAYLGGVRAVEGHFRALADVAANPARDPDAIRAVKRAIRARIADAGDGLFGPARTAAVPANVAAAAGAPSPSPSALLVDLIALVDHNIGAAERYLAAVQAALPGVDFRVVNEFMLSTHIWLT